MVLPLCGPARPGTLNCTGASLGWRTRLCLLRKLWASEAAGGEVAEAPQRGRLAQGSQLGPALMLGPAASSPRAGPGGEPHSLTLRDGPRLLLGASGHHSLSAAACFCSCCSAALPSQALSSRLPSLFHRYPACLRTRRSDSGLVHFPTTGKLPSGAFGFRGRTLSQSGSVRFSERWPPEGQRAKELVVIPFSALLLRSNNGTDDPGLRRR